ncbi:hypothetical protein M1R55_23885 (plasmid) [Deinococcus sp. QL22]|nr:hypothetical protein [Deinococcus sp. QL22]UQN09529.1 hypothetical protein M1R55_23885 [Deinococcus sp. QL22]
MIRTISREAGTARLQELSFPTGDQAFMDIMLSGRFRHAQLSTQDAQDI